LEAVKAAAVPNVDLTKALLFACENARGIAKLQNAQKN
jgi:hypothetical protein